MFTLEASFAHYMFCEFMENSRGSIGAMEADYDAFIEAVKQGDDPIAVSTHG